MSFQEGKKLDPIILTYFQIGDVSHKNYLTVENLQRILRNDAESNFRIESCCLLMRLFGSAKTPRHHSSHTSSSSELASMSNLRQTSSNSRRSGTSRGSRHSGYAAFSGSLPRRDPSPSNDSYLQLPSSSGNLESSSHSSKREFNSRFPYKMDAYQFQNLWKFLTEKREIFTHFDATQNECLDLDELANALLRYNCSVITQSCKKFPKSLLKLMAKKFQNDKHLKIRFDDYIRLSYYLENLEKQFHQLPSRHICDPVTGQKYLTEVKTIEYNQFLSLVLDTWY